MSSPHTLTSSVAHSPPPRLSVVIPLYNCLPLTQAMLTSLQATLPKDVSHEIIFIDDGSTDGTREWLATLQNPGIKVLLNGKNLGYAASNNRAAAIACGEFLALLNNDLLLLPHWLEPMLEAHALLRNRAGLIGNVQRNANSGEVDHAGLVIGVTGKPLHLRTLPSAVSRFFRPVRSVPAVTGACLLMERALWLRLGGFDEAYVNGGEDIDLCFRARAAGRVNAVALRSVVRHHVSSSPGRKTRDEQNSFRLARRWQREFTAAAEFGRRAWCHSYLAQALLTPQSREYRLAIAACLYLARVRATPPPEADAAIIEGVGREFVRWEGMFGANTEAGA
jgi:O-antigen biosynthesis protein